MARVFLGLCSSVSSSLLLLHTTHISRASCTVQCIHIRVHNIHTHTETLIRWWKHTEYEMKYGSERAHLSVTPSRDTLFFFPLLSLSRKYLSHPSHTHTDRHTHTQKRGFLLFQRNVIVDFFFFFGVVLTIKYLVIECQSSGLYWDSTARNTTLFIMIDNGILFLPVLFPFFSFFFRVGTVLFFFLEY